MLSGPSEIADHLLNCKMCRDYRDIKSQIIKDHMEETKEFETCSDCRNPEHFHNCYNCRHLNQRIYFFINFHIKVLKIKNMLLFWRRS